MAKRKATAKVAKAPPPITAYDVSDRVKFQAAVRPYQNVPHAPLVRPLRIYTLDPSVSDRLGGTATVNVPYEKLEPGPIGSLFAVNSSGAPEELLAAALDLDDPFLLLSGGVSPTPTNGRFHMQMVYAVCSLTYAVFRRALGRDIAWATNAPADGPLRLIVKPFAFVGTNAGYSREGGDLSFGYFRADEKAAGFTLKGGLVSTALSHDIIAHETTHALLDGLRSSFLDPTNVDVPAFHEGFSDLVALFLHFTYPDVVEQAIRDSGGSITHGSLLTDIAREFGYARSRTGRADALRSGVDVKGLAAFDSDILPGGENGPKVYDPKLESHKLGSVLVSAVFEAFTTIVRRKTERFYRIAGVNRDAIDRVPPQRRARQSHRAGSVRCRRAVPQYLHPRHRLLPAGGHGARRVSPRHHHRRRRHGAHRQVGIPRGVDAVLPPPRDFSRSRALHDRGRRALAIASLRDVHQGVGVSRFALRGRSRSAGRRRGARSTGKCARQVRHQSKARRVFSPHRSLPSACPRASCRHRRHSCSRYASIAAPRPTVECCSISWAK